MNFVSLEFAIFVPIVFIIYWFVIGNKRIKAQNFFLFFASYVFYGWWDWRFLLLIFVSSAVDYLVGLNLGRTEKPKLRKALLWVSLIVNLGLLCFFKYFNFFIDSFQDAFTFFGYPMRLAYVQIILPVGISFYTLQTLSYTIDVYRRKIEPTNDIVSFFAYVSFFPQLVAGPIERATHFLPQFFKKREFNYAQAADGMRQILWGFFKKVVIADNIGEFYLVLIHDFNAHQLEGSTMFIFIMLGIIQVYCDFSGYSDIAIGTARLFGFNLMKNFDFPLYSRNIAEFWQKWHISLITWIRDYVGRPFGRGTWWKALLNLILIFFLVGLWHGADWNYVIWGLMNVVLFIPFFFSKRKTYHEVVAKGKLFPSFYEAFQIVRTVVLFGLIGVFFYMRTDTIYIFKTIFSTSLFEMPQLPPKTFIFNLTMMFVVEWLQRDKDHGLDFTGLKIPVLVRFLIYFVLIFIIMYFKVSKQDFFYFQF